MEEYARIAIFSDTQTKDRVGINNWDLALASCKSRGVKAIFHDGDVFDSYLISISPYYSAVRLASDLMKVIEKYEIPIYMVLGNHDLAPPGSPSALDILKHSKYVTVYEHEPELVGIKGINNEFLMIPWQSTKGVDDETEHFYYQCREANKKAKYTNATIPIGHVHFKEATFGYVDSVKEIYPESDKLEKVLSQTLDSYGFFGHIHNRETKLNCQYTYVGALAQNNFGECGNEDGWIELKFDRHGFLAHWDTVTCKEFPKYYIANSSDALKSFNIRPQDKVKVPSYLYSEALQYTKNVVKDKKQIDSKLKAKKESKKDMKDNGWDSVRSLRDYYSIWLGRGCNTDASVDGGHEEVLEDNKKLLDTFDKIGYVKPGKALWKCNIDHIDFVKLENSVIDLERVDFGNESWHCITGPNGCGKSTILESVYACFFGQWLTENRSLGDLFIGGKGSILVNFAANGNNYAVKRDIGDSKLHVLENTEKWKGTGVTKNTEALVKIVGSKELWQKAILFTQDRNNKGNFVLASNTERYNILRDYLELDELTKFWEYLTELVKKDTSVQDKVTLGSDSLNLWNIVEFHLQRRTESANKLRDLEKELENYPEREVVPFPQESQDILNNYEYYAREKNLLKNIVVQDNWTEKNNEVWFKSIQSVTKSKRVTELKKKCAPLCDFGCKSNPLLCRFIDEAMKAKKELEKLEASGYLDDILAYEDYYALKERKENHDKADIARSKFLEVSLKLEVLLDAQKEAQEALDNWHSTNTLNHDYTASRARLLEAIKITTGDLERSRELYKENLAKHQDLQKKLDDLKPKIEELERIKKIRDAFHKDNIPTLIIKSAIPELQDCLDSVIPEDYALNVQLDLTGESSGNAIRFYVERDGQVYDAKSCSGGQKDLLALLFNIAVVKWLSTGSGISSKIMLLDEPTSAMDYETENYLINYLKKQKDISQIIMCSHSGVLASNV